MVPSYRVFVMVFMDNAAGHERGDSQHQTKNHFWSHIFDLFQNFERTKSTRAYQAPLEALAVARRQQGLSEGRAG